MTDEKLWLLVSLQLSGEATPAELEELNLLLQHDEHASERVAVFTQAWQARNASAKPAAQTAMSFDKHLQRLSNHLAAPTLQFENADDNLVNNDEPITGKRFIIKRWLWTAAAVAVIIAVFVFRKIDTGDSNITAPGIAANTVSTKPGSKSKIELPDGTQVWLNADSKLAYNAAFTGKLREVTLTGEAYFDVVKDKTRPFIIHTTTAQIKVLGTAFNVRSYPTDKTTETALIRGSVEVTLNARPDKKIILHPNEKVIIDNDVAKLPATNIALTTKDEPMRVSNLHLDKKDQEVYETMWVKNKLAFDETPFDNMIAELERWYNVSIIVKNKNLSNNTYTVTFENKSLDEVLEGLQFSAHFQYQVKDGMVTIW